MKVNLLNTTFSNQNYKQKTFKAHKDFDILAKDYEICASSYFRRGGFYGSPSNDFVDVIKAVNGNFCLNKNKKNILIAGIGESQEPFSLLAVIKSLTKEKTLKDTVDLNIIDLQSKPEDKKLFEQSYFDCGYQPTYVKDSFIKDNGSKYGLDIWKKYRVNDEIFDFLKQTYQNPNKSHWESRIQEVVKEIPSESFDIISINNTLGYIKDKDTIVDTLNNIMRIMKKDGVFITDMYSRFNYILKNKMLEIYKGIFKKL